MDYRKTLNKEVFELMMKKALMEKYADEVDSLRRESEEHDFPKAFEKQVNKAARFIVKRRIIMKIKKVSAVIACIVGIMIAAAAVFLLLADKRYTVEPRIMPGATVLDGESYIEFADLGTVAFYTFFLHYDDIGDVYANYGALDIVYYYSLDCGYNGSGTKIDCEVVELNKDDLILHYYGNAVTSQGENVNVDDYWKINMNDFWNGKYAKPVLIEQ